MCFRTIDVGELLMLGTTASARKSTFVYSSLRYSAMDKIITVDQLPDTNLRSINEI